MDAVLIEERFANPETLRVEMFEIPKTLREDKTPTEVMFACAGFVTVPAVLEKLTVPERFATGTLDKAAPEPLKVEAVTLPKTSRELRVPTLVMFVWAGFTTTPAVLEKLTVPERFATGKADRAAPDPLKAAAVTLPRTSRELRVPTLVIFACAGFVTAPAVFEKFTVPERFATGKADRAAPDPMKVAAVTLPKTSRELRVPTLVMFPWAGFVTAPAVFEKLTVPERFATGKADKAAPDPMKAAAVTLVKTSKELRVPTLVIFAWAGFVTAPAVFEKLTVPERFATGKADRAAPDPLKAAAVTVPKTSRELRVPTDVIFACAGFTTTPAVFEKLTVPERFATGKADKAAPDPMKVAAVTVPKTSRELRVPTLVMFPWEGFVTAPAVLEKLTVPERFATGKPDRAAPDPMKDAAVTLVKTSRELSVPTDVMLVWAGLVTLEATLAAATFPTRFDELTLDKPDASEAMSNPATVRALRTPTDVILGWAG